MCGQTPQQRRHPARTPAPPPPPPLPPQPIQVPLLSPRLNTASGCINGMRLLQDCNTHAISAICCAAFQEDSAGCQHDFPPRCRALLHRLTLRPGHSAGQTRTQNQGKPGRVPVRMLHSSARCPCQRMDRSHCKGYLCGMHAAFMFWSTGAACTGCPKTTRPPQPPHQHTEPCSLPSRRVTRPLPRRAPTAIRPPAPPKSGPALPLSHLCHGPAGPLDMLAHKTALARSMFGTPARLSAAPTNELNGAIQCTSGV